MGNVVRHTCHMPFTTHSRVRAMLIPEGPIVTVICRTAKTIALFYYFNLCPSDIISCSFTSIFFHTHDLL